LQPLQLMTWGGARAVSQQSYCNVDGCGSGYCLSQAGMTPPLHTADHSGSSGPTDGEHLSAAKAWPWPNEHTNSGYAILAPCGARTDIVFARRNLVVIIRLLLLPWQQTPAAEATYIPPPLRVSEAQNRNRNAEKNYPQCCTIK